MRQMNAFGSYRNDFYKGKPWHLKPFVKGNDLSLPYDHDSAVLYRGTYKHIFFHEGSDKKPRDTFRRNQKSVLDQEQIKKGNSNPNSAEGKSGHLSEGVFFAILSAAREFTNNYYDTSGIVLEVQIPTEVLVTLVRKMSSEEVRNYKMENHGQDPPQMFKEYDQSNSEELRKDSGGAEGFREKILQQEDRSAKDNPKMGESIQWVVKHDIPLEWVTGVWDVENSRRPVFISLDEFLKTLKSQYGDHVPANSNHINGIGREAVRKKLINELNEYEEILQDLQELRKSIYSIEKSLEDLDAEWNSDNLEDLSKSVKSYNSLREATSDLFQEEFDVNDPRNSMKLPQNLEEISEMYERAKSSEEGLKQAIADEQAHYQRKNWNEKEIKKEKIFEERVENKLSKRILSLPFIGLESQHNLRNAIE